MSPSIRLNLDEENGLSNEFVRSSSFWQYLASVLMKGATNFVMKPFFKTSTLVFLLFSSVINGASPFLSAAGTATVASFHLSVLSQGQKQKIPLRLLNQLKQGQKIQYDPIRLSQEQEEKGEMALILAPEQAISQGLENDGIAF
jgi:hypothetical protein